MTTVDLSKSATEKFGNVPNEYDTTERPALDAFETLGWEVIDRTQEPWDDPRIRREVKPYLLS